MNGEPVGLTAALGCGGVVCEDGMELPVDVPGQGSKIPVAVGAPGTLVPPFVPLQVIRIGDLLAGRHALRDDQADGYAHQEGDAGVDDRRFARARRASRLVGLANGYLSYMATPEEYDASFYEGSFTLYGRQQGPAVQAGIAALVDALADNAAAPADFPLVLPFIDPSLPNTPALLPEPDPGTVVSQPANIAQFGQATVTWQGGDPAVDNPRAPCSAKGVMARGGPSPPTTASRI